MSESPAQDPDLVDRIAAAVLAVPGVVALHGGEFGEIATYLPGRRVRGIRLSDDRGEVHIAVRLGISDGGSESVLEVAEATRRAVSEVVGRPIDVVVEDLAVDDEPTATL